RARDWACGGSGGAELSPEGGPAGWGASHPCSARAGGSVAVAGVDGPRARSIRRSTSPRPQGTRSPATIAKRDASVRAARSVRARVLAALVLPWARAVQDDAPDPATRHDLAACLPGRYVA